MLGHSYKRQGNLKQREAFSTHGTCEHFRNCKANKFIVTQSWHSVIVVHNTLRECLLEADFQ